MTLWVVHLSPGLELLAAEAAAQSTNTFLVSISHEETLLQVLGTGREQDNPGLVGLMCWG